MTQRGLLRYRYLLGILLIVVVIYFSYSPLFRSSPNVVSLKEILKVCIPLAEMGGDKVREVKQSDQLHQTSKGKTKEGVIDVLTEGDTKSHEIIVFALRKIFPDLKVISEEHDDRRISDNDIPLPLPNSDVEKVVKDDELIPIENVTVWVDPLDATKEYTENLLQYVTTMVCVAVNGKPVIGVIHRPFFKETVWGWVGHGVSPSFHPASFQDSTKTTIIVSRSHAGKVKEVATKAFGKETEVIAAGGAGFKVLQVIQGNASVYIHVTLIKKWDICAGNALLNSIGGKMTNLHGEELHYNLHDEAKNENGLLAALYNHNKYLSKLSAVKDGRS